MSATNERESGWLPVRVDGQELRVTCPRTSGAVSVTATCQGCEAAIDLAIDETGHNAYLRCGDARGTLPAVRLAQAPRPAPTDASKVAVAAIMHSSVAVASPETPLEELLDALLDARIGGAPVVDSRGRVLGIASKTDLLARWRAKEAGAALGPLQIRTEAGEVIDLDPRVGPQRVADVMSREVLSVRPEDTVAQAAALMAYEGVHRLPVVDESDRLVGVVSSLDIARFVAQAAGYHVPEPEREVVG
ncbi:MAG: CBS domain-containing protein [Sandaracinaceae bacterium]|nr:CBS domain-containing protein [Sandaracinaceae bacterium]